MMSALFRNVFSEQHYSVDNFDFFEAKSLE